MDFKYFDAHAHIHFPVYNTDRSEVIARAINQGVGMVTVGTTLSTSEEAVKTAEVFMNIWAAVGVHPAHASESFHDSNELGKTTHGKTLHPAEVFNAEAFHILVQNVRVVAIGECGLDYFRLEGNVGKAKEDQIKLFTEQIRFAYAVRKPLMIHCRSAFPDLIAVLEREKEYLGKRDAGIIHFFSGTEAEAVKLLNLGFSFTFGGVLTFTSDYNAAVRMIPLDRLLSETDAPYVAPVPHRGKRNQPVYVIEVVKKLAELKGISKDEMMVQILGNAERVFHITLQ